MPRSPRKRGSRGYEVPSLAELAEKAFSAVAEVGPPRLPEGYRVPEQLKKLRRGRGGRRYKKTVYEYVVETLEKQMRAEWGEPLYLSADPVMVAAAKERLRSGKSKASTSVSKLGRGRGRGDMLILGFGVPAGPARTKRGVVDFCPAATPFCSRTCYAKKGRYPMPSVMAKHAALGEILDEDPWEFYRLVRREIEAARKRHKGRLVVRVNTSGDLYRPEYVEVWSRLADEYPDVTFYTYTRMWRIPRMRRLIEEKLMSKKNFVVLASTDPDTGPPPPGWPEAGLGGSWTGVRTVCPETIAKATGARKVPSCAECGLCFNRERLKKTGGVVFVPH